MLKRVIKQKHTRGWMMILTSICTVKTVLSNWSFADFALLG